MRNRSRSSLYLQVSAAALLLVVTGTLSVAAPASAQAGPVSLSTVSGAVILYGVACPTAATCEAVGANASGQGVVVPITSGTPGTAKVVSSPQDNFLSLEGVACPTATTCEAVGFTAFFGNGAVVPITSGNPGTAQVVSGTVNLDGVACPTATTCEAVGTQGEVVPITNGTPGTVQVVSGTGFLDGVACPTATTCEAVGWDTYGDNEEGVVVPVTNGAPGTAQVVSGPSILYGVACPTATTCEAVGEIASGQGVVVAVPLTTSVLLPATGATLSGTTATLDASASNATSVEFCLLGGSYGYSGKMIGTATSTRYGWLYSWNTTTVPNASYALVSEALNDGSSAFSAGISITVSNPPTTKVIIPSDGATLSGTSTILDATASNATSVEFWLLGGSYGYSGHLIGTATSTEYGWIYSWNTTTVPNSSYVLLSEASGSGGSAFSPGVSITVTN